VVPHISTGDILRAAVREKTEFGLKAQEYMHAGELLPDDVMVGIIDERLERDDTRARGFILDGFPRTVVQARALTGLLTDRGEELDSVVEFRVPEDELVARLLGRGRADDTEAVIRNRQQVYRDETTPLLEFYADRLISVEAVGSVEEITARVLAALRSS
jgi:adenylate kinase